MANHIWPDRIHPQVSLSLALFAFLTSRLPGVAGGLSPAWKAARLSPMDAIRRDEMRRRYRSATGISSLLSTRECHFTDSHTKNKWTGCWWVPEFFMDCV